MKGHCSASGSPPGESLHQALLCQPAVWPKPGPPQGKVWGVPMGGLGMSTWVTAGSARPQSMLRQAQNTRAQTKFKSVSWPSCVWEIPTQLQARKSTKLVNGLYN